MPKASGISLIGPKSFLFKSSWGFGKTLAAASFALDGPVYLAYFDKKSPDELVTFFRRFGAKGQQILENIEFDVYGSHNCNEYLNKVIKMREDCRYIAFITDSVTMLTSAAVNWSLGFDGKKKLNAVTHKDPSTLLPDWDEYKTETSIVSQVLDICRTLPCHIIWTAHPIPGTKIEGSGASMKVTKVNPIVTYGSKVAGLVPGQFTEIYQFSKATDYSVQPTRIKYLVSTEAIGDDYAKTALGLPRELDITDKLFYEVWRDAVLKVSNPTREVNNEVATSGGQVFDASQLKPKTESIEDKPKPWLK